MRLIIDCLVASAPVAALDSFTTPMPRSIKVNIKNGDHGIIVVYGKKRYSYFDEHTYSTHTMPEV
jgi:hypothetical protein